MWRSEPQMPLASTRTIASSGASSSGSATSSIWTSPGAWKVTALIAPEPMRGSAYGYREVASGADHRLLDRDRQGDGRAPRRRRLARPRDREEPGGDRGPRQAGLQDARSRRHRRGVDAVGG